MSLFWYPELNDKLENDGKLDKGMLVSSYIRYFLARLQSMFIYEGLPDSMPQKWLENLLLVNGSAVIIPNGDKGLIATRAGIGGEPDVYYIPTECIVTNPYTEPNVNKTYKRDVDCVLIVNDTYAQGLLPMLKKYCTMMAENDITLNIAGIMSRASMILSASDEVGKLATITWNDFLEVFGVAIGLIVGATFFSDLMVSTLASFFASILDSTLVFSALDSDLDSTIATLVSSLGASITAGATFSTFTATGATLVLPLCGSLASTDKVVAMDCERIASNKHSVPNDA